MTTRRSRTSKQRLAIFNKHKGVCHSCEWKIDGVRDAWDLDHVIPLEIGGDDSDDNLRPAHVSCHKAKTAKDRKDIAKCQRVREKHEGARASRSPLPGGRNSKWKREIGGRWVRRNA